MPEKKIWTPEDLERFKNVFSLCQEKSSIALSQLVGLKTHIKLEEIGEMSVESLASDLYPPDLPMVMLLMSIKGDGNGFIVFTMFEETAKRINEILWNSVSNADCIVNVNNVSALKEMCNIVGSYFLNALSEICEMVLFPSAPSFAYDMIEALLDTIIMEQTEHSSSVLILKTKIASELAGMALDLLFLPQTNLLEKIKKSRKV